MIKNCWICRSCHICRICRLFLGKRCGIIIMIDLGSIGLRGDACCELNHQYFCGVVIESFCLFFSLGNSLYFSDLCSTIYMWGVFSYTFWQINIVKLKLFQIHVILTFGWILVSQQRQVDWTVATFYSDITSPWHNFRLPHVQWAAHQPTPNCQIYLINFQLYYDEIRFKFHCEILTHWGTLRCCPLYKAAGKN